MEAPEEENKDKDPKRKYKGKKNSNIVNFPNKLQDTVFSPRKNAELLNAPIVVARFIFRILNDISDDQFQGRKQPGQLALFEQEFLTEDNMIVSFTYNIRDLDENRDYTSIQKGLDFLENLDRKWHKSTNSKGKIIRSKGGFIVNPAYSDGKVTFSMTAYWIQKMLSLGVYNPMYFETAFKFKDMKQWLFYLWLCKISQPQTRITLENFNNTYGYNYKTASDACKETLRPSYAKTFDKYANVSFTCRAEGHLIYIYPNRPVKLTQIELSKKTITKQVITQKLAHWKRQHKLEEYHIKKYRYYINKDSSSFNIFFKAYESFKKECKKNKIKVSSYEKDAFFKALQPHIDLVYSVSAFSNMLPNGQPKLID